MGFSDLFKSHCSSHQMGHAVLEPLTVLLPLDITGLHCKSFLGAVTSMMSLPTVSGACLGLLQPLHVLESSGDF